jgi:Holliday junction resolvase RusA-like endonuclease
MNLIACRIIGVPYSRSKTRGDTAAPRKWTEAIIKQTESLPKVTDECLLKVTFLLPADKYPKDLPFRPDLDNLMKRLMDALNHTIFSEVEGKDSCVVEMRVKKTRVGSGKEPGALIECSQLGSNEQRTRASSGSRRRAR